MGIENDRLFAAERRKSQELEAALANATSPLRQGARPISSPTTYEWAFLKMGLRSTQLSSACLLVSLAGLECANVAGGVWW